MTQSQEINLTDTRYPEGDARRTRTLTENEAFAPLIGMMSVEATTLVYEPLQADSHRMTVCDVNMQPVAHFTSKTIAFQTTAFYRICYVLKIFCTRQEIHRQIARTRRAVERCHFTTSALEWPARPFRNRMEALRYVLVILFLHKGLTAEEVPVELEFSEEELTDWVSAQLLQAPH